MNFLMAQLKLDEKKISTREYWKRQIIVAGRQKQPASFGFYSPAKDDGELDGTINTKRVGNLFSLGCHLSLYPCSQFIFQCLPSLTSFVCMPIYARDMCCRRGHLVLLALRVKIRAHVCALTKIQLWVIVKIKAKRRMPIRMRKK